MKNRKSTKISISICPNCGTESLLAICPTCGTRKVNFIKEENKKINSLLNQRVVILLNDRFHVSGILEGYDHDYAINIGYEWAAVFEDKAIMKIDALNNEIYVNEVL